MSSAASPQPDPASRRQRRVTLSIATCIAIGLAALLAWTTVLKDDVVLAEVTSVTGDIDFTGTLRGEHVDDALDSGDGSADDGADGAERGGDSSGARDGRDAGGSGSGSGDDDGSGTGPRPDERGPGESDSPPPAGAGVTIDGFTFSSGENLAPGERMSGEITLRNAGEETIRVTLQVTGSDPFDCFRFTTTPLALDETGDWLPVSSVGLGGSPAAGGSLPIGVWAPGQEYRVRAELAMNDDCTVGSGLSSNGSVALADRHPDHATARLNVQFVSTGAGA